MEEVARRLGPGPVAGAAGRRAAGLSRARPPHGRRRADVSSCSFPRTTRSRASAACCARSRRACRTRSTSRSPSARSTISGSAASSACQPGRHRSAARRRRAARGGPLHRRPAGRRARRGAGRVPALLTGGGPVADHRRRSRRRSSSGARSAELLLRELKDPRARLGDHHRRARHARSAPRARLLPHARRRGDAARRRRRRWPRGAAVSARRARARRSTCASRRSSLRVRSPRRSRPSASTSCSTRCGARRAKDDERRVVNGILLVDKPDGLTSAGVVRALKRAARAAQGRPPRHARSVRDRPAAALPRRGTKIAHSSPLDDKRYVGTIRLGVATDTLDRTGTVDRDGAGAGASTPRRSRRSRALHSASISQTPPMYSALKRDGVPLYRLARAGIEVERAAARIEIVALELARAAPTRSLRGRLLEGHLRARARGRHRRARSARSPISGSCAGPRSAPSASTRRARLETLAAMPRAAARSRPHRARRSARVRRRARRRSRRCGGASRGRSRRLPAPRPGEAALVLDDAGTAAASSTVGPVRLAPGALLAV